MFSDVGSYIVQLKVRDSYGEESSLDSFEITVTSSKSDDENNFSFEMILLIAILIIILIAVVYKIYTKRT